MKFIISGGAGFIGSHVVDKVLSEGHSVVVVDNLSSGNTENINQHLDNELFEFVEFDVTDSEIQNLIATREPSAIIHLAAQIDVRESVEDPVNDAVQNIIGTINILEGARKANSQRVVFTTSGGAIYGNSEQFPLVEDTIARPQSPYGASKLAAEEYCAVYHRLYGIEWNSIAPSNVYGPRQSPHGEAGVVAIFNSAIINNRQTLLFGDGKNTRDYVFVSDVANAFYLAATSGVHGERFHACTGVETQDRELHAAICSALNASSTPKVSPPRTGDIRRSCLSPSKAVELLNWKPQTSLPEGLDTTAEFFKNKS